jgi:hypothetical protein
VLAGFHLLFTGEGFGLGGFSTFLSYAIVVGALYGALRLVLDILKAPRHKIVRGWIRWWLTGRK